MRQDGTPAKPHQYRSFAAAGRCWGQGRWHPALVLAIPEGQPVLGPSRQPTSGTSAARLPKRVLLVTVLVSTVLIPHRALSIIPYTLQSISLPSAKFD